MKKKLRFPIRVKLAILTTITIAVAVATLGVFLSLTFSNSAFETASNTLVSVSTNASLALENSVSSVETSMNLLANQIGYDVGFANSITTASSDKDSAEQIRISLAGADGSGDGSTIIGAMDYLIVSDSDIESATMYSPFIEEPILSRLLPVSQSRIAFTEEKYNALKEHPGHSFWFYDSSLDEDHLFVWKALVNFGIYDNYDMQVVGYIEYVFNKTTFLAALSDTKYENEGMILFDEKNDEVIFLSSGEDNVDKDVKKDLVNFALGVNKGANYTAFKSDVDINGWKYISFINHNSINAVVRQSSVLTIIIVSISVIAAFLVAFLMSAREIKRIKEISKTALAVANGDYTVRTRVNGNDELTDQAIAINHMAENIQKLISELIELNKMLVLQSDSLTENFATVVSNKSGESGYHVRRVSTYSEILAKELGFDEEKVHSIKIASTLHDIGKLMIDDSILHKPGRFNDEERKIMQNHVTYGAQILKNVPGEIMEMGARIALYHHERWDGNGYVNGLKGDEIPIEAQIASVADVFDALISKRCYKESWDIKTAYDEIVKNKGSQFSPRVVDAFMSSFEEIKSTALMYLEKESKEEESH